jgi:hypothetical protein
MKKTALLAGSTEYFKPNFSIVDNIHPIDSKGDEETLPSLQLPKTNEELEGLETEPRSERPGTESQSERPRPSREAEDRRPIREARGRRPSHEERDRRPSREERDGAPHSLAPNSTIPTSEQQLLLVDSPMSPTLSAPSCSTSNRHAMNE